MIAFWSPLRSRRTFYSQSWSSLPRPSTFAVLKPSKEGMDACDERRHEVAEGL
jgi:hypothetical protein